MATLSTGANNESGCQGTRWRGIERPYSPADVDRLRGNLAVEYTLACKGAGRFWELLQSEPYVTAPGATTGQEAVQQVMAGAKAIYASGRQAAADADSNFPIRQNLNSAGSVPALVAEINHALRHADEVRHAEDDDWIDWYAPLVAAAEAGPGGALDAFESVKTLIEAGAAAVHFDDRISAAKIDTRREDTVLVPTAEFIRQLVAARLAADVAGVPSILIARTHAGRAKLISSNADVRDGRFMTGQRTPEGNFLFRGGLEAAVVRALACASLADVLWFETTVPDLDEARVFARAVHAQFPGKMLAYNCAPWLNSKADPGDTSLACFQKELSELGYKLHLAVPAGFQRLNPGPRRLAGAYRRSGRLAYAPLGQSEFDSAGVDECGSAWHQSFIGAGYYDRINELLDAYSPSSKPAGVSRESERFHSARQSEKQWK